MEENHSSIHPAAELYLDLLKRCLTRELFPDARFSMDTKRELLPYSAELRRDGHDWPTDAVTMAGAERLNALDQLIRNVILAGVPGDFVECGVWRGGCSILMRGALAAWNEKIRNVWLYDSFMGLPKPTDPTDCDLSSYNEYLGVSIEVVQNNFRQFGLLDHRVKFVPGWFNDTLPKAEVDAISILRLDGDMYESTWVSLQSLYPKLSPGGYVIVDDFGAIPQCARAVNDFRADHRIDLPISTIDWTGIFWQKE